MTLIKLILKNESVFICVISVICGEVFCRGCLRDRGLTINV